jgi:hypothetical protein
MRNDIDIIKRALDIYSRYETEAIEKSIENLPPLSPSFYTRLDERAEEIKRSNKKSISVKKAITILVAATLIIACLSVVAYAVAERTKIGGFFVEWFEGHVQLRPDLENQDENLSVENVKIGYIPDGFTIVDQGSGYGLKFYEWKSDEKKLYITYSISRDGAHGFNTENNNFAIITIGDLSIYKAEYTNQISLMWTDGNFKYNVDSNNVEWEELIKIVEGISYEDATA